MLNLRAHSIVSMLLLILMASACGSASTVAPTATPAATAEPTAVSEPTGVPTPTVDFEVLLEDFDPNNFDNPINIDNPWFPLQPGSQWIYEGVTEESGFTTPHRVIFTVTDLTKEIGGIRTVVVWDQDYSAGELVETELAFFAQDNDGNVWHLGQYPEVYENGMLIEAPAWIHGLKGARAGLSMKAASQPGTLSYSQGWGPAVNWTDRAQIAEMGAQTCVPVDCYEDVLVTEEFSREEPDAFQLKYYAQGVGNVRVGWKGADATKEMLELVDYVQLSPEELADVRLEALELEQRAYEMSKEVYDQTPPSEPSAEAAVDMSEEDTSGENATEAGAESEISAAEFEDILDLDPANFDNSTTIDNEWWPLSPGTQYIFEGFTVEGDEEIPHRIVFTVTDLTKVINGVRTVVVWDRDFSDDQLEEAELAFFAQDNDGNVWHFGQYRETYDEVEFVGGRVWLVDLPEGAKAGIMMPANPQLGMSSYSQGYAPAPFNWTDRARVYEMGQQTTVAFGSFDDVLIIEEYNAEEPGAFQHKYYARGVGNVRVGWRGDDTQQEELELVDVVELDADALAAVRAEALELEKRAYMYSRTLPAE